MKTNIAFYILIALAVLAAPNALIKAFNTTFFGE